MADSPFVNRGETASRTAAEWAERTLPFRQGALAPQAGLFGHYARVLPIGDERVVLTADGIGTKVEVAERLARYDTLGFDLLAMVTDDLAAIGAEPCVITNVLDVSAVDDAIVDALFAGLHAAASEAKVAVACGELAELGERVGGYGNNMHFAWSATCVGHLPRGWAPIDGSAVEPGQVILAVAEPGLRANGFSCLRRELGLRFGDEWHRAACGTSTWGDELLRPSRICAPLVLALRRAGVPLTGIAHVTGGGIPNKLGRVLRARGGGARLFAMPLPAALAAFLELGAVPLEQAYHTFHMGPAMLLVLPREQVERALAIGLQAGFALAEVGVVEPAPGIRVEHQGEWLEFAPSPIWSRP